jgi:hypothetical protein
VAAGANVTVITAIEKLDIELAKHNARDIELSANFRVGNGGRLIRDWDRSDPGCCVRYDIGKVAYTLPCDTFTELSQNIAALANHLDYVRRIERIGVATTAQTMGAFMSLPAPTVVEPWYVVLGVTPEAEEEIVKTVYRTLARKAHPDAGGSDEAMSRLNVAMESYEASKAVKL